MKKIIKSVVFFYLMTLTLLGAFGFLTFPLTIAIVTRNEVWLWLLLVIPALLPGVIWFVVRVDELLQKKLK